MKRSSLQLLFAVAALCVGAAHAQVTVTDPWVRATVPGQQATGAFMRLQSAKDVRLVSASSPLAPTVEVHEMAVQDNVMKMRQLPALELPAAKTVELKPGGYHVMLMGLKQPVKAGGTVAITLVFEDKAGKRETQVVNAPVRPLGAATQPAAEHKHKH